MKQKSILKFEFVKCINVKYILYTLSMIYSLIQKYSWFSYVICYANYIHSLLSV